MMLGERTFYTELWQEQGSVAGFQAQSWWHCCLWCTVLLSPVIVAENSADCGRLYKPVYDVQCDICIIQAGKNSFWAQSWRLIAVNQPTLSFVSVKYFFSLAVPFTWFHLILCNTGPFYLASYPFRVQNIETVPIRNSFPMLNDSVMSVVEKKAESSWHDVGLICQLTGCAQHTDITSIPESSMA